MSDSKNAIADFFMVDFFGLLAAAAMQEGRVGARFLWVIWGELDGRYLMTLTNDKVDVERIDVAPAGRIDGVIEWKLSEEGIEAFLLGKHGLTAALDAGELVVHSDRAGYAKLGRAALAWSKVNLSEVHHDLDQHVARGVMNDKKHAKQPRMVRASTTRQTI